ncbi:Hypothetical protein SRAE_1000303500 [Strongyloides ratti]|uniref:Uncharacterized protein n=1 Tax=Strongyloides ratti TaxID=34506 RepID=A0A090L4Z7_STRRB|nr:Hypothetical protein SRAE_1000303500 [Strongyloides ratti]CEF64782.1 Hypothetical protein SRAE_1000303500 [Strongyloides ratti]
MSELGDSQKRKLTSYCVKKRNIKKFVDNLEIEKYSFRKNLVKNENLCLLSDFLEEEEGFDEKSIIKNDFQNYNYYPMDCGISNRLKIISNKSFWWMNDINEDKKVAVPMQIYELDTMLENKIIGIKKTLTYYMFPSIPGVQSFPRLYNETKDYQLSSKKFNVDDKTFDQIMIQWNLCLEENIYLWRMKKITFFYIFTSFYTIYFGNDQKIILNGSTACCRKRLNEVNISYDIPASLEKLKNQLNNDKDEKNIPIENNKKSKIDEAKKSMEEIETIELNELKGTYPVLINLKDLENFITLLKDKTFIIPNYGIHCHLPPTIVSSNPFCNSTIKELTITSRIVKPLEKDFEYHIEIDNGPIFPSVGIEIIKYLYNTSTNDNTSVEIHFYGKENYYGLNSFFEGAVNILTS